MTNIKDVKYALIEGMCRFYHVGVYKHIILKCLTCCRAPFVQLLTEIHETAVYWKSIRVYSSLFSHDLWDLIIIYRTFSSLYCSSRETMNLMRKTFVSVSLIYAIIILYCHLEKSRNNFFNKSFSSTTEKKYAMGIYTICEGIINVRTWCLNTRLINPSWTTFWKYMIQEGEYEILEENFPKKTF